MNNGILQLISAHIGTGADNITTSETLRQISGLDNRSLRKCIEQLRRSGCVIISAADGGYYKPATLGELQKFIKKENSRALSILYTLTSARSLEQAMIAAEQATGVQNGK